ncbi:hypothetical protein [Micromonospora profundi]|uniref:hypothetical protein n=1 Tax=Micromonospora profundi TaxID=1420889 RepID=UPI0036564217
MQPTTAAPRHAFTDATIVGVLRDAPALTVGKGLELIDRNLQPLADLSDDLAGGTISRNSYATLHATASLALSRELAWQSAIVRPYMTVSDGTTTARFNLGAYYTAVPSRTYEQSPPVYDVTGYDILHGLYSPTGEAYAVDAGVSYLAAVEQILVEQGYTRYLIDYARGSSVLPSAKVWPLDDQTRWLTIVNDLLAAVGYQGIWSDWDGQLRCQPYQLPSERPPEWVYGGGAASMLSPARSVDRDFFEAPNRWVFVRQNNVDDLPPYEGNGIHTYQNDYAGETSVEARDGRVITKVEFVDAADHEALVRQAQITIDADMRVATTVRVATSPNPLHWHFDRLLIDDPDLGRWADVLGTSWTLPLDGGDMQHEWTLL